MLRHDIYSLETPLPTFSQGRALLLGDAAHAITPDLGQGAGLALEDAVTLAGLAASTRAIATIVETYDKLRRSRTQRLVRISARAGRVAQWNRPMAVAMRNGVARLIPESAYLRAMADTFSWRPDPEW